MHSRSLVRRVLGSLALLLGLLFSQQAEAATLQVPTQYPTIQSAITAAQSGDTILVAVGVYAESLDWENKDLTLQGSGQGQSIIDPTAAGGQGGSCLTTNNLTSASRIDGFTLQNGNPGNDDTESGGGILNFSSSLTISNCTFTGNSAYGNGGAIDDEADSSLTIFNCTFTGNSAGNGGAIDDNAYSSLTISNCTFTGNFGSDAGGGIYDTGPNLTLINCTFTGNHTGSDGGGIFDIDDESVTISNCTFTDNHADYQGGGLCVQDSKLIVTNSIFWGNTAYQTGGLYSFGRSSVLLTYTDDQDLSNATPDANHNFSANPGFVRPPTNGPDDPGDLHLLFGSPAIDSGLDSAVTVPPYPADAGGQPTDLDGNPRISRAHVDLGAYEYQNLPAVANAGGNQTVTASHSGNPATDTASLTLNGSATDPENDALTFAWTDSNNAVVGNSASLSLMLKPGTYIYTLTVTDMYGASNSQSVQVVVNPAPNRAPSANSQSVSLNQDTSLGLTLSGSDPDGDSLTYSVSNTAHGTLSGTAPDLTYTPNAGYVGADSFTFTVTDPYGATSNTATISLNVKDTTPPVITLNGSNPMTVNQGSVFTDPGATAVDNVDGPVPVSVSGSVNTAVPGAYTLTYSATDKAGNLASKTRTVNVVAAAPKVTVKLTTIGELLQVVGVVVTIQNSGSTTIDNVKITSAALLGVNAALIVPDGPFSLAAGKSADVALAFYPLRKGRKGTLSISGTYSGGTFSLDQSVTIP